MKKFLLLIVVVLGTTMLTTGCGREDEIYEKVSNIEDIVSGEGVQNEQELQQQLAEANKQIEELKQQNISTDDNAEYIKGKFKTDGTYYRAEKTDFEGNEIKFYQDRNLTQQVIVQRFISDDVDGDVKDDNGRQVYGYLSESGKVVYSSKSAGLLTEEEYNRQYQNN